MKNNNYKKKNKIQNKNIKKIQPKKTNKQKICKTSQKAPKIKQLNKKKILKIWNKN